MASRTSPFPVTIPVQELIGMGSGLDAFVPGDGGLQRRTAILRHICRRPSFSLFCGVSDGRRRTEKLGAAAAAFQPVVQDHDNYEVVLSCLSYSTYTL